MRGKRYFFFGNIYESITFHPMLPQFHFFHNEWITFTIFLGSLFLLISLSEIIHSRLHWSIEATRKLVHIFVGIFLLISLFLFQSNTYPAILAILFILINATTLKFNLFKAMHPTSRKSYGTIYFPIAYLILILGWWNDPYALVVAFLLLTFADTAATIVGESAHSPERFIVWQDSKTVQGSIAMFLTSIILITIGLSVVSEILGEPLESPKIMIPKIVFLALLATAAEATSSRGSDNLTIPIITVIGFDLFNSLVSSNGIVLLMVWIIVALIISIAATYFHALTDSGALGALIMGIFVFGTGGIRFLVPLIAFFILSSLLSSTGRRKRHDRKYRFGKGSRRDIVQVYANGGVPFLIAIWHFYSPSSELYIIYLASLAAANADTWGTEIGFFSRKPPRSLATFKQVPTGSSGGISIIGTFGSILGATTIGGISYLFLGDLSVLLLVSIAGFAASLIDSILGATLQANFECRECYTITELERHCDIRAMKIRGIRELTNDTVNLLCTLSGSIIALVAIG